MNAREMNETMVVVALACGTPDRDDCDHDCDGGGGDYEDGVYVDRRRLTAGMLAYYMNTLVPCKPGPVAKPSPPFNTVVLYDAAFHDVRNDGYEYAQTLRRPICTKRCALFVVHCSDAADGTFQRRAYTEIGVPLKHEKTLVHYVPYGAPKVSTGKRGRPSENDDTTQWCIAVRRYVARVYGRHVTIPEIVALAAKHAAPIAPNTLRHRIVRLTTLRWSDVGVWGNDPECGQVVPPAGSVLAAAEDYVATSGCTPLI